eukprot:15470542-Alexandrium_andersonii.AAC.1
MLRLLVSVLSPPAACTKYNISADPESRTHLSPRCLPREFLGWALPGRALDRSPAFMPPPSPRAASSSSSITPPE